MGRLLFFLLVLISFAACKTEPVDEKGSVTQTRPITPPEGGPIVGDNKQPSMRTEKLFGFLCTGYWYVEAYVKINDRPSALQNRGRWYQFSRNGTFISGKFKETTAKGVWTYDPMKTLVFLDSENDAEDGEWKIQMGNSGTVMIFVGTERFQQNSIQMKLENYIELMSELPPPGN